MRVLLVEDDPSLGEGLRTTLRRAAYAVDWLQDGASALAAIRDGGIDLAGMVTDEIALDGLPDAFARMRGGRGGRSLIRFD